jgi:hypothetical protein
MQRFRPLPSKKIFLFSKLFKLSVLSFFSKGREKADSQYFTRNPISNVKAKKAERKKNQLSLK